MKHTSILYCAIFFLFGSSLLQAKEISIKMIANNCNGCHGIKGSNNKIIPNMYKLDYEIFLKKMLEYKKSNLNSVMVRITKVLSEVDIKNLADYYSDEKK